MTPKIRPWIFRGGALLLFITIVSVGNCIGKQRQKIAFQMSRMKHMAKCAGYLYALKESEKLPHELLADRSFVDLITMPRGNYKISDVRRSELDGFRDVWGEFFLISRAGDFVHVLSKGPDRVSGSPDDISESAPVRVE